MAPEFLKNSYRQYKDDTDRFATWLLNAGKKCGYQPADLSPTSTAQNGSGKGKQKTKSRDKFKSEASEPPKYRVDVGELRKLAEAVGKSAIKAPASVLAVAKRAISLRKNVTSWFFSRGHTASNMRHAHFIRVMEEICDVLQWETSTPAKGPAETKLGTDDKADTQSWLNRFAALTVEEVEDVQDAPSAGGEIIKAEAVEGDEGDEEEEHLSRAFFKMFCLFRDLQNWRTFISNTWAEYSTSKIDLMSASIVTDSALQFARDLIDETTRNLPDKFPKKDLGLQQLLYATACVTREEDTPPSTELGLPFNKDMWDIVEWSYLDTGTLLNSFVPVIKANSIPVYKPGYFGVYNPKANRARMSVADKFNEDKLLVMELLPEFCMIEVLQATMPVWDGITSGFVDFARHKRPSLFLSFSTRIMLDAHHTLRSSRVSPLNDLRMTGLRIKRTTDDYWKLSSTHPKPAFWHDMGDEEIKRIQGCIESFVQNDGLLYVRKKAAKEVGRENLDSPEYLLYSRNPTFCGLLMFHLNLRMQTIGQALVNQWYDVQQMAFLYNLIQKSPNLSLSWPDIEMFIKIHGENRIFVGGRPNDAAQSLQRLELATGISSATRFAKNPRQPTPEWHKPDGKSSRLLEPTTKTANLFRCRYEPYGTKHTTAPGIQGVDLERFLDEVSSEAHTSGSGSKRSSGADVIKLDQDVATPQVLLERKWRNTHTLGTLQLLALIKDKLSEEEPVLVFNYFGMHKRSIEMLRLIKAKEHHKFVQYFTAGYMPDDTFLSNLVMLVFHVARGSAAAGKDMGLGGGGAVVASRIVASCADEMRPYLAKNGDVACKELRAFCRNKTLSAIADPADSDEKKEADKEFMYWFGLEEIMGPAQMESLKTGIPLA